MEESLTREEIDIILRLRQRVVELEEELATTEDAWKKCRSYILGLQKDAERFNRIKTAYELFSSGWPEYELPDLLEIIKEATRDAAMETEK